MSFLTVSDKCPERELKPYDREDAFHLADDAWDYFLQKMERQQYLDPVTKIFCNQGSNKGTAGHNPAMYPVLLFK